MVRRRAGQRDGRPLFADVLGELRDIDDNRLVVATATGEVRIPRAEVHRSKRVPPKATATPAQVVALERVAARGWLPPDHEYLGQWLLRSADGWTGRANSTLPLGDPGWPVPAAIDRVAAWYRERGREPWISVPSAGAQAVRTELIDRGWLESNRALVQVAALGRLTAAHDARIGVRPTPDGAFLAAVGSWKRPPPPVAHEILASGGPVAFAAVDAGGERIGTGRGVVTDGWLGLSLVWVAPDHRRTGLARAIVAGLAEWAAGLGASRAYLQVAEDNAAAVGLYTAMGFRTHHRYAAFRSG